MGAEAKPRYLPAGESALVVEFGQTIDPALHDRVLALDAAIAGARFEGVNETVPTYRSLMVHFDPGRWTMQALAEMLDRLETAHSPRAAPKRWRIPACYDPPFGEDLAEAAAILGVREDAIVAAHSGALFRVYMYGFAPGFMYLGGSFGGLPAELQISRRATPRPPAPPGSLLIAGGQALITGVAMPTGWYAIGRTPVKTFERRRERMFFADVGDEIVFEPIDAATFEIMSAAAEAGDLVAREDTLQDSNP
ncbi:5-oxoprolinase subunit B family protein [Methylocapsa palsarum]|uniref:Sensor histidine kinase inhibitor, KipI family n=1 Tax=Methylocapsa palsarum TaxID=1612308 RepID=A0A1I3ZX93_9HYPH|nr:allophanate hydrolase subunit 1 [Methylocapsa palsarum]SFK48149.1 sensor histidine kinase inhibitor, KipI family [Methylocapsa palsarum]